MTRMTGRKRDNPNTRWAWNEQRRCAVPRAIDESTIVQPCAYLMDQKQLPDCVGKSYQGRLNALLGVDPSGVDLWIECRSYDGNLRDATQGTTAESAIEILLNVGWLTRDNLNEDDIDPNDSSLVQLPALDGVMAADDRRMPVAIAHQVFAGTDNDKHAAILAALRAADDQGNFLNALSFGTGVLSGYFDPPSDTVLDETFLSSNSEDGHEQGLIGWVAERNAYLVQGSWGSWTSCTIAVNGLAKRLDGCCLVARGVIEHAWAVDCMRVR